MNRDEALALLRAHRAARTGGMPAAGPRPPGTQAALFALRQLLPAVRLWQADGDDVLARLAGGRVLAIGLDPRPGINGLAVRDGALRRASIDEGVARALFELAAALWSNPAFLPEFGPAPTALAPPSFALPVPRGLEYVAASVRPGRAPPARMDEVPMPGWLAPGLASMAGARRQAFERTVLFALRFLLRHELAHVLLGHLDFVDSASGRGSLEEAPAAATLGAATAGAAAWIPYAARRAFEIEADQEAARELFASVSRPGAGGGSQARVLALLGATLAMLVFAASHVLGERPDAAITHPPLWFRAHELLVPAFAADAAAPAAAHAAALPAPVDALAFDRVFTSVGATHPMLGEWIGPVMDGRYAELAERVLAEARFARADFLRGAARRREEIIAPDAPDA